MPARPTSPAPDAQDRAPAGAFRPCVLIPTFDNPATLRAVVERAHAALPHVVVIDDGSGPAGRAAAQDVEQSGLALVHHRPRNGGKGAAVKTGFQVAAQQGYTHALQVDADGQHDLGDVPALLAAARARPEALVLGAPRYDASAPAARRHGRKITKFWTDFETMGPAIEDPMCGFRVYPLADAIAVAARGDRMDFDIEIAVRLVWRGLPVVHVPTRVRYLPAEAGGVSHFQLVRDNLRISLLHARLSTISIFRRLWPRTRRPAPQP